MGVSLTNHKLPNIYNHVYPSYLSWCFSLDLSNHWLSHKHTIQWTEGETYFHPTHFSHLRSRSFSRRISFHLSSQKKHGTITMNNLSLPATKFLLVYILTLCTAKWTLKTLWSVFALESLEEPEEQHMTSFTIVLQRLWNENAASGVAAASVAWPKDKLKTQISLIMSEEKVQRCFLHFCTLPMHEINWNQIPTFGQLLKHSQ